MRSPQEILIPIVALFPQFLYTQSHQYAIPSTPSQHLKKMFLTRDCQAAYSDALKKSASPHMHGAAVITWRLLFSKEEKKKKKKKRGPRRLVNNYDWSKARGVAHTRFQNNHPWWCGSIRERREGKKKKKTTLYQNYQKCPYPARGSAQCSMQLIRSEVLALS